jgi:rSAM/selenodomain-associated transferase 1
VFRTQPPPAQRLLIFARLPVLGDVKTRLAATIGDARALAVYEAMLRDTLHSVGLSDESLSIEVLWAPGRHVDSTLLRRAFPGYALAMQTGPTLGDRLAIAFSERFYFHRTQKIVAIGVDDPLLPRTLIDSAFELLDSCEWVLGPATDGGYYLIGCRAAAFDNEVFGGIDWGTDSVFSATVSKIRAWQTTLAVLPARSDIDVADDLHRFIRQSPPGELSRLLTEWQWDQQ